MKNFILALLLFQNGTHPVGVVTGVVNGPNGVPAAGVRVFAIEAREGTDAARSLPALESISVTDNLGRYRLEIVAGRYYIASGSVESPTYSPGTPDIAGARVVPVSEGAVVANVDFSSFVPASRTPQFGFTQLPPGSTGVLSGVIRYADGTPASGIAVTAVPPPVSAGTLPAYASLQIMAMYRGQARSDTNGRYRINNVAPGTYVIAAGYSETPAFYPGTSDILAARTITTTPATNLDMLDFTVPLWANGMRISGRVTASGQVPALGAMLRFRSLSPVSQSIAAAGLPSRLPQSQYALPLQADGRFEYMDVPPGEYVLEAIFSGAPSVSRTIVVTDQPVNGLELSIPIAVFSGRILWEDGSALPSPQSFGEAIVTTVNHPSMMMSIIMPISPTGVFERPMESDEFRFHLRNLPEGYGIKSVVSDGKDLLKETLKVGEGGRVNVEIRVQKKTNPEPGEVRLSGKALDAVTGAPAAAEQVIICCRESGIAERFSTPLGSDGSFEFKSIPPGQYNVGLQVSAGRPNLFVVNSRVDVGSEGVAGIEILSAQRYVPVLATTVDERGVPLNAGSSVSVVFVGTSPRNRVVATSGENGMWSAVLPAGDIYTATVDNLPTGYSVKSTSSPMDFRTYVPPINPIGVPPPDPVARIILSSP